MTVEEKRAKVKKYCSSTPCNQCKLDGAWCDKHDIDECRGCYLDEALVLISEEPEAPKDDVVNHPSHYTQGGMECIDEMVLIFGVEATMNFCLLNAWKYRKRCLHKGKSEEDMAKSDAYLRCYKSLKEDGIGKF